MLKVMFSTSDSLCTNMMSVKLTKALECCCGQFSHLSHRGPVLQIRPKMTLSLARSQAPSQAGEGKAASCDADHINLSCAVRSEKIWSTNATFPRRRFMDDSLSSGNYVEMRMHVFVSSDLQSH